MQESFRIDERGIRCLLCVTWIGFAMSCADPHQLEGTADDGAPESVVISALQGNATIPFATNVPASFDWRSRHGANRAGSPYFDGDSEGQGGWMTRQRNQTGCLHCGVFAAVGAVEAVVNLYFNEHIDLRPPHNDLSEANVAACSCQGSAVCAMNCEYGLVSSTASLTYMMNTGAVGEHRSPYSDAVGNVCRSDPSWGRVKIAGYMAATLPPYWDYSDISVKRMLIQLGPMASGISGHAMTLVGYRDVGASTVWIFKKSTFSVESNYPQRGDFIEVTAPMGSMSSGNWTFYEPISVRVPITTSPAGVYGIRCLDLDRDGLYNWGISQDGYLSCPSGTPAAADCDDSNPALGTYSTSVMGQCLPR